MCKNKKKTFLHYRGQIRGGNDEILGKFNFFPFFSAKSPFFHHQNLKKDTFCAKIKKTFLHSRGQIRGGNDEILGNLLFLMQNQHFLIIKS